MAAHFEDVKAAIRKDFGSLVEFERQFNLATHSVSDWGRGRSSRRVEEAILLHLRSSNQRDLVSAISNGGVKSGVGE